MKRLIIIPIFLMVLIGCSSQKSSTDYARHQTGDATEQSTQSAAEISHREYTVDSLFNILMQRIASMKENQEQESEHISEKISTYTDSLGRNVREENRSIERKLSKQAKEQQQIWEEQVELMTKKQFKDIDSMLYEMVNRLNIHWMDSLKKMQQSEKEPKTADSLSKFNMTIFFIIVIMLVVIFGRRLKRIFHC